MVEGFKHSVSCQRMMVFDTLRPFGKDCFFAAWGNRATSDIYKKKLVELAKRLKWRRRTAPLGAGGAEPHYISERQKNCQIPCSWNLKGTQDHGTWTWTPSHPENLTGMEYSSVVLIPFTEPAQTSSVRRAPARCWKNGLDTDELVFAPGRNRYIVVNMSSAAVNPFEFCQRTAGGA